MAEVGEEGRLGQRSPGRCATLRVRSVRSPKATGWGSRSRGSRWSEPTSTRPAAPSGKLIEPRHELVTLIEGEGARPGDTRRVTEWLNENHPEVAVEVHHGGQPLYPYLISIE